MTGKPHTEETKRRISQSNKGRPKSPEMRARLSAAKTGKPLSEAHKESMSRARKALGLKTFTGRHHTEETKALISEKKRQRPHEPAKFATNNRAWQQIANHVRIRDGHCCLVCNRSAKARGLPVHHIIPYRLVREHHEHNLITLCRRCHAKVETLGLWDYCASVLTRKHGIDPLEVRYDRAVWDAVISGQL